MAVRLRRVAAAIVVALVFVVLVGATYQGVATAFERRRYPHPGRLVKAGTHQLHIHCTGEGRPTVVLEAPATAMSSAWGWVQPAVSEQTRVCSYDRAGLGWSEWGQLAFDPAAVPVQLHTLLANAGEQGPFVLVGQGFGAALARLTAARYPNDIAALLLIDPPSEVAAPSQVQEMARSASLSPWLARAGLLRVTRQLAGESVDLPQADRGALRTFLMRPDHLTRAARELAQWNATIEMAAAAPRPHGIEVVTLDVSGGDRTAMLTQRADGLRVAAAVLRVVEQLRK